MKFTFLMLGMIFNLLGFLVFSVLIIPLALGFLLTYLEELCDRRVNPSRTLTEILKSNTGKGTISLIDNLDESCEHPHKTIYNIGKYQTCWCCADCGFHSCENL